MSVVKYIVSIVMIFFTSAVFSQQAVVPSDKTVLVNSKALLKDPTRPLGYKIESPRKKVYRQRLPVLQSVVIDSQKRLAIMNNQSYEAGQKVNGYKIIRIEQGSVALTYRSKTYKINLYSNTERFIQ